MQVFLDRDGTIIRDAHYPNHPDQVELLPGAVEGLLALQEKGYHLYVVSNQSGVARGKITPEQMQAVDRRFRQLLVEQGVEVRDVAYCVHGPDDDCGCRKPRPGMVHGLLGGDPPSGYCIGDKISDLQLAHNAGLRPVLVKTGKGLGALTELESNPVPHVLVYDDLREVGRQIPPAASNNPA